MEQIAAGIHSIAQDVSNCRSSSVPYTLLISSLINVKCGSNEIISHEPSLCGENLHKPHAVIELTLLPKGVGYARLHSE